MKHVLSLACLGILLVFVMAGCTFGLTLEKRLQEFEDYLNFADRTNIQQNFHPTETSQYSLLADPAFFDTPFPLLEMGDTPYVITIIDKTNPGAVTAQIDSTAIGFSGPYSAVFTMAMDGTDYKIAKIWANLGGGWYWVVQ